MVCPKKNPTCVKHTDVVHDAGCGKSGNSRCQDGIHLKTCWSEEELEGMTRILDNYIEE